MLSLRWDGLHTNSKAHRHMIKPQLFTFPFASHKVRVIQST